MSITESVSGKAAKQPRARNIATIIKAAKAAGAASIEFPDGVVVVLNDGQATTVADGRRGGSRKGRPQEAVALSAHESVPSALVE